MRVNVTILFYVHVSDGVFNANLALFRPRALTGRHHLADGRRYMTHEIVFLLLSDLTCACLRALQDGDRCASFGRTECSPEGCATTTARLSRSRGPSATNGNGRREFRTE